MSDETNVELRFDVPLESAGERLDQWLANQPQVPSRSQIKVAADADRLSVDDKPVKASYRLRGGEVVVLTLFLAESVPAEDRGEDLPIEILYEDEHMLAINKAAGMVVHPAVGNRSGTLVNAVLGRFPAQVGSSGPSRAGIVHRLDRDTSGVILVARNVPAQEALALQFRERQVHKTYLALVKASVREGGRIDLAIGRHPRDRKRMSTVANRSRAAVTDYKPVENFGVATLLQAHPLTGRTHQLRVHFSTRGMPILADPIYGGSGRSAFTGAPAAVVDALNSMPRLALHAAAIEFAHPVTKQALRVEAPLPDDFRTLLGRLRAASGEA